MVLFNKSITPITRSTKRREGINPKDNALKLQLIRLSDYDLDCLNIAVTSTPGLLAQGVNPRDISYQSHIIMSTLASISTNHY